MSSEHMENRRTGVDLIALLRGMLRSCRQLALTGIILVVVCSLLLCFNAYRSYSPSYQATATFTVNVTNPLYTTQQYYNAATAEQMAKTFPYILTSGVLTQHVRQALDISYVPSISARAMTNTNIFTLTVTSGDPQLAYDVLNCVIEIYPEVAEFVVGPTVLTLLSESGLPSTPTNSLNYLSSIQQGVMLGVVAWLALCLLYAMTHQTIHSEEELGKLVNLSCLGRLPTVRGYLRSSGKLTNPLITMGNDRFGFRESVLLLRMRLEKAMQKKNHKVLLVTSTIPNEGKTTVSANLAAALAMKGYHTLLVDCDLRNPSAAATFGYKPGVGFSNYLRGDAEVAEVLTQLEPKNLFAVFGGKPIASPAGFLRHNCAREFIKAARQNFDYIILDTPPCALMADAAEIAPLADCALLVVRQDYACKQQILEGVQLLEDNRLPIIGCALNLTASTGKSGYSYFGYYGGSKSSAASAKQQEEGENA